MKTIKQRTYEILEPANYDDAFSRGFDIFIVTLILANVIAFAAETVTQVAEQHQQFLNRFEIFSVVLFSVEYVLRLWVCTKDERYRHPVLGRLRYAVSPMALVDLFAILPFYLPMIVPIDLRFLRILRLTRLVRAFKIGRYSEALLLLKAVIREKKEEIFICLYIGGILLVVASSLMYYLENPIQPDNFPSIPAALWWGVATLTTVGYGDVYPITPLGKVLGAAIAVLGIGLFALPAGILASGFADEIHRRRSNTPAICPHCGKPLDDSG
jgi:voltage-gated potassium channel